jgi:hypothetical protein
VTARREPTKEEILRTLREGRIVSSEPVAGSARRPRSLEGCIVHPDGSVSDEDFHADILDNPEAERALAGANVKLAVELGMAEECAKRVYGRPLNRKAEP